MSIIVEVSVSSPEVALCAVTSEASVTLELTEMIATDPEQPVIFFWAESEEPDAFDAALRDDWTTTDVEMYTETDQRRLYRAVLSPDLDVVLYPVWVEAGASRLASTCQNGVWRNRMRFPDRESFDEVRRWCLDQDVSLTLHRLYTETVTGSERAGAALSEQQARTLERAYEMGYYDIPQGTTVGEIAAAFNISQQALSERLHRGHAALIETFVVADRE